jgi:S1-C subfamily serine protease
MDRNGDSADAPIKRKQPPTPSNERPMKQMKAQPDSHTRNGARVPMTPELNAAEEPSSSPILDDSLDQLTPAHLAGAVHDTAEWQRTIEHVVRNVVSIQFCQTCSFDTESAISSEATGFVVDAEQGYILTNRHVVGAGPFVGYCIFDNHEEVSLAVS